MIDVVRTSKSILLNYTLSSGIVGDFRKAILKDQLIAAIKKHYSFLIDAEVDVLSVLKQMDNDLLINQGIVIESFYQFTEGVHDLNEIMVLGDGSAEVVCLKSPITVRAYNKGTVSLNCSAFGIATVELRERASLNLDCVAKSVCRIIARDKTSVRVNAWGLSSVIIHDYDDATIQYENKGNYSIIYDVINKKVVTTPLVKTSIVKFKNQLA